MAKYGQKTQKKAGQEMHKYKHGKLTIGSKGGKVKSRQQAIAIALSESRRSGYKAPPRGH